MNHHQFWQLIRMQEIIFEGVRHCEKKIDALSQHLGATLPPGLVKAGQDLEEKRKELQSAIDAQSHPPISTPEQQPSTKKDQ